MAGSGKGSDTKICGIITLIIYAACFFLMSLILIGISVKVCEKVTVNSSLLSIFRRTIAYALITTSSLFTQNDFMKVADTG